MTTETATTALAIFGVLCLIGAVIYWMCQAWKLSQEVRRITGPRIQSPTQRELEILRAKQAAFDAGDDRELPMLLKRNV